MFSFILLLGKSFYIKQSTTVLTFQPFLNIISFRCLKCRLWKTGGSTALPTHPCPFSPLPIPHPTPALIPHPTHLPTPHPTPPPTPPCILLRIQCRPWAGPSCTSRPGNDFAGKTTTFRAVFWIIYNVKVFLWNLLYIFGGIECVGHTFAYVALLLCLKDGWIRTQSVAVANGRASLTLAFPPSKHLRHSGSINCGPSGKGIKLQNVFLKNYFP